jgi:uncharacterized RDD family membrane protein YckC
MDNNVFQYQTSEKVKIEYEIAGIALRCAAFVVDFLIRSVVFFLLYIFLLFLFFGNIFISSAAKNGKNQEDSSLLVIAIIYIILIGAVLFYNLIFELIWKGQTPGKRLLRVRAVYDDGTYINATGAILRNIFRIVDMLPVGYVVAFIVMMLNKKRKRIGDFAAGTIVIHEYPTDIPRYLERKTLDCFSALKNAAELFSPKTRKIIESYFTSKNILKKSALNKIEHELVSLIEKKTGINKPGNVSSEDFISALYWLLE